MASISLLDVVSSLGYRFEVPLWVIGALFLLFVIASVPILFRFFTHLIKGDR